jgi:hypothetical protein
MSKGVEGPLDGTVTGPYWVFITVSGGRTWTTPPVKT